VNRRDDRRAGVAHRGTDNGRARLTEADVRGILVRHAYGETVAELARCFGVQYTTVWQVVAGKTWRHVTHGVGTVQAERAERVARRLGYVPEHVRAGR